MNDKISKKDKKAWENFLSNNERLPNKDFLPNKKNNFKIKRIDLHGYTLEDANKTIKKYITVMHDGGSGHLHNLVITGVERPLLEMVLKETNGNQTQAANILGINRNTLRKKMQEYNLL